MNSTININMNINTENKSLVKTSTSANPSKQTNSVNPLKQPKSSASSEKKVEPVKTIEPVKTVEPVKTIEPVKISNEDQSEIANYINSLSKHETQTLEIAKSHLGSSFTIRKSIGFLEWKSTQKQKQE